MEPGRLDLGQVAAADHLGKDGGDGPLPGLAWQCPARFEGGGSMVL